MTTPTPDTTSRDLWSAAADLACPDCKGVALGCPEHDGRESCDELRTCYDTLKEGKEWTQ